MTDIEPNEPLLRKTLEHIKHHPEHWDQLAYRHLLDEVGVEHRRRQWNPAIECGTAMCFAGWACDIAGVTWRDDCTSAILVDGYIVAASDKAQELLGLTQEQCVALFDTHNTLEDLERIVDDIVEGRPTMSGFELREWS